MNISDFYYIHTVAFCCNVCFAISRDVRSLDSNNMNEGFKMAKKTSSSRLFLEWKEQEEPLALLLIPMLTEEGHCDCTKWPFKRTLFGGLFWPFKTLKRQEQ